MNLICSQIRLWLFLVLLLGLFNALPCAAQSEIPKRPSLGVAPFEAVYRADHLAWMETFLQEALTWQTRGSSQLGVASAESMRLWLRQWGTPATTLSSDQLNQASLQWLVSGRFQKVLNHMLVELSLTQATDKVPFRQVRQEVEADLSDPDELLRSLYAVLQNSVEALKNKPFRPLSVSWEAWEELYRWKIRAKPRYGTPDWTAYRQELEGLLARFPNASEWILLHRLQLDLYAATRLGVPDDRWLSKVDEDLQSMLALQPQQDQLHALQALVHYYKDEKLFAKSEAVVANASNPRNAVALVVYGFTVGQAPADGEQFIQSALQFNPFLQNPPWFDPKHIWPYELLSPLNQMDKPLQVVKTIQPSEGEKSYEELMKLGAMAFEQERYTEAKVFFDQAEEQKPEEFGPLLYRVRIHIALKDLEGAYAALTEKESQFGAIDDYHMYLGLVLEGQQKYSRAEASYRKALYYNQNNALVMMRLGTLLIKTRHYQSASAFLHNAVKRQPDLHIAWWNLGLLYLKLNQPQNAVQALEQAVRLQPNNARYHRFLGQAKAAAGS